MSLSSGIIVQEADAATTAAYRTLLLQVAEFDTRRAMLCWRLGDYQGVTHYARRAQENLRLARLFFSDEVGHG